MNKLLSIIKWEYVRAVKSKQFIITTLIFPLIIGLSAAVPVFIQLNQMERTVGLVDLAGVTAGYEDELAANRIVLTTIDTDQSYSDIFETYNVAGILVRSDSDSLTPADNNQDGTSNLSTDSIVNGYHLVITDHTADTSRLRQVLGSVMTQMAIQDRIDDLGITQGELNHVLAPVSIPVTLLSSDIADGESDADVMPFNIMPMVFAVLLVLSGMMSGTVLMQSVIKEKQNRISEILFSSTKASVIMNGKVIGFALLGITQLVVWGAVVLPLLRFLPSDVPLPPIDWTQALAALPHFIAGYIMFSGLFAMVGAASPDAQTGGQTQGLVVLVPMLPIMLSAPIMTDPNALWVKALGWFPLMTPGVHLLRMTISSVPIMESILALALSCFGAWFILRAAGRIFLFGMLRTGKPATAAELIRWVF